MPPNRDTANACLRVARLTFFEAEFILKKSIVGLALVVSGPLVHAAEIPSAGTQLQLVPAAPAPERAAPQLSIQKSDAPAHRASGDAQAITVNSLHVIDARAFPESDLIATTGFTPGSALTLSNLRDFAAAITTYYRNHGYFLARAYLPAQDIVNGAVTVAVIEGRYGKVVVRNQSSLSDRVASSVLEGLNGGDAIEIAPLESRLLQLSDLPGVEVKSTLVPGASVGASDLIVDLAPGRRVSGSLDADNSGSRYTGANRTGATVNLNNPFGQGDAATLRVLTSWDGLNYGRAAYRVQLGRSDVGVAYTALRYDLGKEFASLDAHGSAQIASLYGRYPLLRSRASNLYAQFGVDAKKLRDEVGVAASTADKHATAGLFSLVGDFRDHFAGGGASAYSLTWTTGNLELESAAALGADSATARTDGHYRKVVASFMRIQRITDTYSLYGAVQGQLASQNLDVSEKMELGGANGVRAYPEGEAYLDQGYVINVEARALLPKPFDLMPGQLQLAGFLDSGTGHLSKTPWSAGENTRTLNGGGLGLSWFDANKFSVKAYYAHTIGAAPVTAGPSSDSRVWISAVKFF